MGERVINTNEVVEIRAEIPEGHKHLRTRLVLSDGEELVLQEATVAAMVRAYIDIKTHPQKTEVELKGRRLFEQKEGFAEWQLVEGE